MAAVNNDGEALRYASPAIQGNREIVLKAVKKNGNALHWASADLQREREVVLVAATNDVNALRWTSPDLLKTDADVRNIAEGKLPDDEASIIS